MAKLHFYYAVMNSGKSTHLLQARHNYISNGGRVLLLTSVVDDRLGVGKVSSRIGISADAVAVGPTDDIHAIAAAESAAGALSVVLIDEVQFLTRPHILQAARVADELGVPVMCYGLKVNAYGDLFGDAVKTLLALADQIHEIEQMCWCRDKANMILKYDPDGTVVRSGAVVEVGAESRYVSVCRKHWKAGDIGPGRRAALADPGFQPRPHL